jgi:hypothetical protein
MFRSTYQETPSHQPLSNLPGELLNMVYKYALFSHCHTVRWKLVMVDDERRFWPIAIKDSRDSSYSELHTISMPDSVGAMNKQICAEVRTLFWTTVKIVHARRSSDQHGARVVSSRA